MRLIDAEALINSTDKEYVHKYEVALAPTVDAVPISVIEDIKAEIRQKQWHLEVDSANQVIEIIDKHLESVNK